MFTLLNQNRRTDRRAVLRMFEKVAAGGAILLLTIGVSDTAMAARNVRAAMSITEAANFITTKSRSKPVPCERDVPSRHTRMVPPLQPTCLVSPQQAGKLRARHG